MARRAFETSLAVAIALHVTGVALLSRVRLAAPPAAPHRQPLQIEIETIPAEARVEPAPAAPSPAPAGAADRRLAMIDRGAFRSRKPSPALEALPHAALPARAAPSPAPSPARAPSLGLDQLGVGANNPLLGTRFGSAPAHAARAPNVAPGIQRSMAQAEVNHDARIGLGPEGPVLAALEAATSRAPGPLNGHARFAAVVSGEGRLESIDVLDVGEAHAVWRSIAQRAAVALARRKLHEPAGGRAVRLLIDVVSREAMPSGTDPGFAVNLLNIPVKKGQGKHSASLSILPLPVPRVHTAHVATPHGHYDMPWVDVPVPGLALAGDLSDIGAKASRVVHAHLLSTVVL